MTFRTEGGDGFTEAILVATRSREMTLPDKLRDGAKVVGRATDRMREYKL
jgi:hypothetical protein